MYPNTIYRVSIKAYITDEQGRVFVVRENDKSGESWWCLTGGGLDHGETPEEGLKREIREELGIEDVTVGEIAYTKSFYLDRIDSWLIWIVYHAKINSSEFVFDDSVTDAKFLDMKELASSEDIFEKAIVEIDAALRQ